MNKRGSSRKNGTLVVVEIVPSVGGFIQFKTAWKRPSETADAFSPSHTSKTDPSPSHSCCSGYTAIIRGKQGSILCSGKARGGRPSELDLFGVTWWHDLHDFADRQSTSERQNRPNCRRKVIMPRVLTLSLRIRSKTLSPADSEKQGYVFCNKRNLLA
jgi:hypothetical protein